MIPIFSERIRVLNNIVYKKGPVLYLMSRDQRVEDNWALLFALQLAKKYKTSCAVAFFLDPQFLGGGLRQLTFKLQGLQEIEEKLVQLQIPFFCLTGTETFQTVYSFIKNYSFGAMVTDFSPLRGERNFLQKLESQLSIPLYEVDTHNIVPCWLASNKQEFGAYTLRPKIKKHLPQFLTDIPKPDFNPFPWTLGFLKNNFDKLLQDLPTNQSIFPLRIQAGEKAAHQTFQQFIKSKIQEYEKRNDPNLDVLSDLSPYFHYGHISPQRVAFEIYQHKEIFKPQAVDAFLEEMIVRRELSDNFCFYNPLYDTFSGFPAWAQKTLHKHREDIRSYIYNLEEFEQGVTHDDLWNAAQHQMVQSGKMHGFLRMYWAKKILEWTKSPEEALKIAIILNDRYELDGRDPNGYTGIAWAIGGVHDRPWKERPIFGMVRYMNFAGCERKFDVKRFIEKYKKE